MPEQSGSLSQIVADMDSLGADGADVSIGQLIERFGQRSYGATLLLPAALGISPVGGIPGVPALFAVMIRTFAVQMLIGRTHLWLPSIIGGRTVPGARLQSANRLFERPARILDRVFHGRMEWATAPPFPQIAASLILVLCAIVVPLELIPLAAAIPFAGIAAFGLAVMVRDGALMLAAIAASLGCASLALAALGLLGG